MVLLGVQCLYALQIVQSIKGLHPLPSFIEGTPKNNKNATVVSLLIISILTFDQLNVSIGYGLLIGWFFH